jgi:hypothetical protein
MKTHRVTIDISAPNVLPKGRLDADRVTSTTKADIARYIVADAAEAAQDATRYTRQACKR